MSVPPSLEVFKSLILKMIQQHHLNVELSGVAILSDATHQYYSASLAVVGEGKVPPPSKEAYDIAHRIFQQIPIDDFSFSRLWKVSFVMSPDLRSCRWQVNYLFRD